MVMKMVLMLRIAMEGNDHRLQILVRTLVYQSTIRDHRAKFLKAVLVQDQLVKGPQDVLLPHGRVQGHHPDHQEHLYIQRKRQHDVRVHVTQVFRRRLNVKMILRFVAIRIVFRRSGIIVIIAIPLQAPWRENAIGMLGAGWWETIEVDGVTCLADASHHIIVVHETTVEEDEFNVHGLVVVRNPVIDQDPAIDHVLLSDGRVHHDVLIGVARQ